MYTVVHFAKFALGQKPSWLKGSVSMIRWIEKHFTIRCSQNNNIILIFNKISPKR